MCVTPGGKIGNCTCGMPNCCHIRAKKAAFFAPPIRAKKVSFHFLSLPIFWTGIRSCDVAHSSRIDLDMLVVTASPARTALKISQLTDGGMPPTYDSVHWPASPHPAQLGLGGTLVA